MSINRLNPYLVQHEILKTLGCGFSVLWDRYYPTPGIWNYVIQSENGVIGMIRFEWPRYSSQSCWQYSVQRMANILMRALQEATHDQI